MRQHRAIGLDNVPVPVLRAGAGHGQDGGVGAGCGRQDQVPGQSFAAALEGNSTADDICALQNAVIAAVKWIVRHRVWFPFSLFVFKPQLGFKSSMQLGEWRVGVASWSSGWDGLIDFGG